MKESTPSPQPGATSPTDVTDPGVVVSPSIMGNRPEKQQSFYELLGVSNTADADEIEVAYEAQYNHWRRLVTHYDTKMVNKANQVLQQLDKARMILLDPNARRAYDAGIGLGGLVGGLADPQAKSQVPMPKSPPPPPPAVSQVQSTPNGMQRTDAWICSKCQTANAVETRFCRKCGRRLGTECPQCESLIEARAAFCPSCGVNVGKALRQKQMEEAERIRKQQEEERRRAEEKNRKEAEERKLTQLKVGVGIMGALLGAIAAPVAWVAVWPDVMGAGICLGIQALLGAIGGAAANVWVVGSVNPSNPGLGYTIGFVMGILGGIFAFPALVILVVIALL